MCIKQGYCDSLLCLLLQLRRVMLRTVLRDRVHAARQFVTSANRCLSCCCNQAEILAGMALE